MGIRIVIFDLDGTIVENAYDWPRIRKELGTGDRPILSYLSGLKEPVRSEKWGLLERHEAEQTENSVLRGGVREFLSFLAEKKIIRALVTNNSLRNTTALLTRFGLAFEMVLTRESGLWKPSGAPFRRIFETQGVRPEDGCVIGDTRFDVLAAEDAGISRIFLVSDNVGVLVDRRVEIYSSMEEIHVRFIELLAA